MKNLIPANRWVKRLAMAAYLMPLMLLVIAGCETDPWANFSALPPTASNISNQNLLVQSVQSTPIVQHPAPGESDQPIILREGDVVNVVFPSSPTLDTTQQIRRDGKIVMPLIGEVAAAGQTPENLQKELIKLYEPQVATKQIIVTVQSSTYPVFVTGAVLRPGRIDADHPMTALEAVMQAGGFDTTKANSKSVVIVRQEKTGTKKFTLNLQKMMNGSDQKPFYLKPSDIIYVPEKFQWF